MRILPLRIAIALLAFAAVSDAQGTPPSTQASPASTATVPASLAVFMDCQTDCDGEFIRTEINWVNWVRDRTVADVHVLITAQSAGAGGQEVTLAFLGARSFAGRGDTLVMNTNPTTTADERRRDMVKTLGLGLVPFVARTSSALALRITRATDGSRPNTQTSTKSDPWKAWVFNLEANAFMNGERAYRNQHLNGEIEANRVTDMWKSSLEYSYSRRSDRATVQEFDSTGIVTSEETFRNTQRDWELEMGQVRSVTGHGGVGGEIAVASQTFRNQKLRYSVQVAAEYNIFPFREATRRELSFRYGLGVSGFRYVDTTIFGRVREVQPTQTFQASYNTRQPWGQVEVNFEHNNYLKDASKKSAELNGNVSIRVFRGFTVEFGGGYNWIRDQIYLPKGEQNTADVLLRRRALLTGFEYYTNFGIGYTFGSIFNNVVNPRF